MNLNVVARYLNNHPIGAANGSGASSKMCSAIETWRTWYEDDNQTFHTVTCSNGVGFVRREMFHLRMAKRVAEDWASALLSEDLTITVNAKNNKTGVFVQGVKGDKGVLGSANFSCLLSDTLEKMCALGTCAIVVGLDNAVVTEDGTMIPNPDTRIVFEAVDARGIIPETYYGDRVINCCFVGAFIRDREKYFKVSRHVKEEDGYVIYTAILNANGEEVRLPDGVLPVVRTKSFTPLFHIFRTNIVNNVDELSPLGVSVYNGAIEVLKAIDHCYDACVREVITGQKIILFNKRLLGMDNEGRPIAPNDVKQTYMQFFGDDSGADVNEYIKEFTPTLNTEKLDAELQNQLNMLSMLCQLGTKYYSFNFQAGVTATEFVGERQDMVRNAKKLTRAVTSNVANIISNIIFLGVSAIGRTDLDTNAKVVVTASDGVVEDDSAKREADRQDVNDGLMSKVEYRMKWYGETEDEATKALERINAPTPAPTNSTI